MRVSPLDTSTTQGSYPDAAGPGGARGTLSFAIHIPCESACTQSVESANLFQSVMARSLQWVPG